MRISLLLILNTILFSCMPNIKDNSVSKKELNSMSFNAELYKIIDSFSTVLKPYKENINVLGYVKFFEYDNNNRFKVLVGYIDNEDFIKQIHIDDYFVHNDLTFIVDFNLSNIMGNRLVSDLPDDIRKIPSLGNEFDGAIPSWLIQLENNEVSKINKKFIQNVQLQSGRLVLIDYYSNGETLLLNEWGNIIDSTGNIIRVNR